MNPDRSWMYTRHDRGFLPPDFFPNLEEFVNFAVQHPECMSGEEIKCPCSRTKCRNTNFRDVEVVKLHVLQSGFVPDYYVWIHHGEVNVPPVVQQPANEYDYYNEGGGDLNYGQRMVIDAAGPEVFEEETPNDEARNFFDMMSAAEEEIWPGNSKHSPLSASVEILDIKCRHQGSISLIDDTCRLLQELLPENNKMPKFFANIKKLVKGLGLPVEVIDCCFHNCMIYWGADEDLTHCKVCTFPRWKPVTKSNSAKRRANVPYKKMFYFPLTPRLQRLYASKATAKHMTWHAEHEMEDEKMCHPSDSPAWKRFSELHTDFADETRNIRLGLCTDGFQPFGSFGKNYSSWPVIVTPYNLPPGMCMKDEFMFLTILVPGPGRLACPYCMENTEAFTLPESGKQSWFDCHRKFLPTGHHFRRNVTEFRKGKQVRHQFGGVRTGDEVLAEVDGLGFKRAYENDAKATNDELSKGRGWNRKSIFWDLPCVDLNSLKMMGMKSHDCHVFMQRLLPIALRELLPAEVWEPLTELSIFFRELTATSLKKADLQRLEFDIPKILCKLERIFPPSFFDSMEHLPVHLPYEAMMAGPVQYRWMYPFERYLRKLKNKVSNKGRVEGSISSGYLLEETAKFASFYFKDGDPMVPCRMQRNEVCEMDVDDDFDRLNIFKPKGRPVGACRNRYLDDAEYVAARSYILLNCLKSNLTESELYEFNPEITQTEVVVKLEREFAFWFEQYVKDPTVSTNPYILSLAKGPLRSVKTFKGYCVNGFKFNTEEYGEDRVTMNSGVCVKGSLYGPAESDFYGVLTDIIELEYPALPIKRTVLFKCNWFDPTKTVGMLVHPRYNIVDVNHRRRYNKYEPFILAEQSDQVHYLPYPSKKRDKKDWWAVCKIKARSELDMPETTVPAFQDDSAEHPLDVITNDDPTNLVDPNGEADEAALHNPPIVETEDDYPPSSSDDDDIGAEDDIEIA
ncbi:uncharacterized protein LOC130015688 [Mercurialis annua]|uniref:uncharacterized protein LOC130015688 n=1 Tax=Mercurialis annua TaxID=3986 RepID=UPI0024ADA257|nr:uncharacterized protein LOC130015688 [Mercurialis annua]